ncbi:hypothetical protein PoB_000784700 [Plakobranchus ocellatus]|uniref:Uncharacterized protein n=1 Tax=Plakobranchus ocellatus TaxID=259542 RepID=A0AAV3YFX7_9GAST|nr:hypothetical protein PoB_000784700 [Plakobranchus ocellatus]
MQLSSHPIGNIISVCTMLANIAIQQVGNMEAGNEVFKCPCHYQSACKADRLSGLFEAIPSSSALKTDAPSLRRVAFEQSRRSGN